MSPTDSKQLKRAANHAAKPEWLKVKVSGGELPYARVHGSLRRGGLSTVCEQARCPNRPECWGQGTATFLLLGDVCTRHCRFCAVRSGDPGGRSEDDEPQRIAAAVHALGLRYVVLTSVDRDDLQDGGAAVFAATVQAIVDEKPDTCIELLIPDFAGRAESLEIVARSPAHVIGHNLETVERLTPGVRDRRAGYRRSLAVLEKTKTANPTRLTKSSLMLGLGETFEDVLTAFDDLRAVGCDLITLGQYLQPTSRQLPVVDYLPPESFDELAAAARQRGFGGVVAGPLVRSSYAAARLYAAAHDRAAGAGNTPDR